MQSEPDNDQVERIEQLLSRVDASTKLAERCLEVIASALASNELPPSVGRLAERSGLSRKEWHGSGELIAAAIQFCHERDFKAWHANRLD